jgi:hypothetical protein
MDNDLLSHTLACLSRNEPCRESRVKFLGQLVELELPHWLLQVILRHEGEAFRCLAAEQRGEQELVLAALEASPDCLRHIEWSRLNVNTEVLSALGTVLSLHAQLVRVKVPKRILLRLLKFDCTLFAHIAPVLGIEDQGVVLAALSQDISFSHLVPHVLKNDVEFLLEASRSLGASFPWNLADLQEEARAHLELVLDIVSHNGSQLRYANLELQQNIDVALAAVSQDGLSLEYVGHHLKSNVKVVRTAVKRDGNAIQFASMQLRCDHELVALACDTTPSALHYCEQALACFDESSCCSSTSGDCCEHDVADEL